MNLNFYTGHRIITYLCTILLIYYNNMLLIFFTFLLNFFISFKYFGIRYTDDSCGLPVSISLHNFVHLIVSRLFLSVAENTYSYWFYNDVWFFFGFFVSVNNISTKNLAPSRNFIEISELCQVGCCVEEAIFYVFCSFIINRGGESKKISLLKGSEISETY